MPYRLSRGTGGFGGSAAAGPIGVPVVRSRLSVLRDGSRVGAWS
jgi:hypothetical protein